MKTNKQDQLVPSIVRQLKGLKVAEARGILMQVESLILNSSRVGSRLVKMANKRLQSR